MSLNRSNAWYYYSGHNPQSEIIKRLLELYKTPYNKSTVEELDEEIAIHQTGPNPYLKVIDSAELQKKVYSTENQGAIKTLQDKIDYSLMASQFENDFNVIREGFYQNMRVSWFLGDQASFYELDKNGSKANWSTADKGQNYIDVEFEQFDGVATKDLICKVPPNIDEWYNMSLVKNIDIYEDKILTYLTMKCGIFRERFFDRK